MLYRIEAGLFPHLDDTIGRKTAASIREALGIPVKSVRTIKVFTLEGLDAQQVNTLMAKSVLHDPVLQAVSLSPLPLPEEGTSWIIEVGYRPGVTDNEGRTARDTAALVLGIEDRSSLAVYTSIQYRLHGPLTEEQVTRIARDLLANELIQRFEIKSRAQWDADPGFAPKAARVTGASCDEVNIVPLSSMSDAQLMEVSQKNTLALSLEEMTKIKNWFSSPEVAAQRKERSHRRRARSARPDVVGTLQAQDFRVQDFLHRQGSRDQRNNQQPLQNLHHEHDQADPREPRRQGFLPFRV